jgi:hypothetical protein
MIMIHNILKQFSPDFSLFAFLLLSILITGCGTLHNGHRWAEDATLLPGWKRLGNAAVHAVSSTYTWLPAGGAVVLQVGHLDKNISDWAIEHTPVFGSQTQALRATDTIRKTSDIILYISMLTTPSGDEPVPWLLSKAKGCAVDFAALALTEQTVTLLKKSTRRKRPDNSDDRSFPSSHASGTSLNSTLAYRNIQYMHLSNVIQSAVGTGLTGLSLLGAWGRVEGSVHYLSDVLAGLALGHFAGVFFQDAFLGIDAEESNLEATAFNGCFILTMTWRF